MASSSSSTQNHRHLFQTLAPPPTPSSQPNLPSSSDATVNELSLLLGRLPPNLSLPSRFSPRPAPPTTSTTTTPLQTISLSPRGLLSLPSFEPGFFQLSNHSISPELAKSAEKEASSLFDLPLDKKLSHFPKDWPLGFNSDDDDDDCEEGDEAGTFCMDCECSTTNANDDVLSLTSLRELTRELEKVGLELVEELACAIGVVNPLKKKENVGAGSSSLVWISDGDKSGRVYPYVVGLQYQIRAQKWSLVSDTGSVVVEPEVGSVLVMLGDIAQVWSNGKLKKVRGRPSAVTEGKSTNSRCISLTLLITLPIEATVSPLRKVPAKFATKENEIEDSKSATDQGNDANHSEDGEDYERVFNSFSFEDYAWRVYHERLPFKDPLDKYRIVN